MFKLPFSYSRVFCLTSSIMSNLSRRIQFTEYSSATMNVLQFCEGMMFLYLESTPGRSPGTTQYFLEDKK